MSSVGFVLQILFFADSLHFDKQCWAAELGAVFPGVRSSRLLVARTLQGHCTMRHDSMQGVHHGAQCDRQRHRKLKKSFPEYGARRSQAAAPIRLRV
jgi:hypothetical protein